MEDEHNSFQDEIRLILKITQQVAAQITKDVSFLNTNPNDAAIEENILDIFNQFSRRAHDILYGVIILKSQANATDNMMNSAFEFLQHLKNSILGFEVIVRNKANSPLKIEEIYSCKLYIKKSPMTHLKMNL
jgi:2,4-dienoyl-CoA reductase-like NADH-dependent reductase (Old Yellow Enzyme family)